MEERIKIKMPDRKRIYGTLNYRKKTNKLIIFVHGLTGHQNEHLFYNATKFFPEKEFATFRFNLYGWEKDAQKFRNCTLGKHTENVNTIINFFKRKYSSLYLVGHSLGAPTILLSDCNYAKAVVLLDPSYSFREFIGGITKYDKKLGEYILDGAYEVVVRDEMYKSLTTDFPDVFKLVRKVHRPIKIIAAGKGLLLAGAKKYLKSANNPKELVIIKNATHCFDEEGTEEKLFKETLSWIKKF